MAALYNREQATSQRCLDLQISCSCVSFRDLCSAQPCVYLKSAGFMYNRSHWVSFMLHHGLWRLYASASRTVTTSFLQVTAICILFWSPPLFLFTRCLCFSKLTSTIPSLFLLLFLLSWSFAQGADRSLFVPAVVAGLPHLHWNAAGEASFPAGATKPCSGSAASSDLGSVGAVLWFCHW